MQINIDSAKVEAFKNWFLGRVPAIEYEEDFSDLPVNVEAESDLPVEGDPEAKYYVAATGDTYRFRDGAYHVVDVYSYGLTSEYRDKPRRIISRQVIVDPAFNIPSINAEQIRAGASASLATLYNIQALLTDLAQIRRIHVTGYKTTLMEFLGQGPYGDRHKNVTEWFSKNHTLLYRLLASAMRDKDNFNKEILDALFHHKYVLTWDTDVNRAVFKMEDFTVYL